MVRYKLRVDEMSCIGCEQIIQRELDRIDDLGWSDVDHESGLVEFTSTDPKTGSYVEHVLGELGYNVRDVGRK